MPACEQTCRGKRNYIITLNISHKHNQISNNGTGLKNCATIRAPFLSTSTVLGQHTEENSWYSLPPAYFTTQWNLQLSLKIRKSVNSNTIPLSHNEFYILCIRQCHYFVRLLFKKTTQNCQYIKIYLWFVKVNRPCLLSKHPSISWGIRNQLDVTYYVYYT
jgi:hypothetical protein